MPSHPCVPWETQNRCVVCCGVCPLRSGASNQPVGSFGWPGIASVDLAVWTGPAVTHTTVGSLDTLGSAANQSTLGCLTGPMSVGYVTHLDYSQTFVTDLRRCPKDGHFLNIAHILSTVFDMRQ